MALLLTTRVEYTKTLLAEEKRFTLSQFLFLRLSLSRSFSFSLLSLFHHAHVYIGTAHSYVFVKRGRVSGFIYLFYSFFFFSFFFYEKSTKDHWYSFCICACLSPLSLFESLLLFVSALLVRCGSALLINLILAVTSRVLVRRSFEFRSFFFVARDRAEVEKDLESFTGEFPFSSVCAMRCIRFGRSVTKTRK